MARFEAERLGGDAAGLFSAQRRQLRGRLPRLLQTVVRGLAWGNVRCRACAEIAFRPAALAGSGRAAVLALPFWAGKVLPWAGATGWRLARRGKPVLRQADQRGGDRLMRAAFVRKRNA